ncbi:MAG: hypothetical protein HY821_15235 [Acidobacteria bacterium]|nr:hypothetical protein [Acidobacteriota bacterium]
MQVLKTSLLTLVLAAAALGATPVGKWKVVASTPDGNSHNVDLIVKDEAGKLSASLESERGSMPLQDVAFANDELTFKLTLDIGPIPFKLKIDGDTLKGTITIPDGSSGTVTGKRDGAAAAAATPTGASVAGKWKVASKDAEGNTMKVTIELKQDGEKLTGQLWLENGDGAPITDGKVKGNEVSFKLEADGTYEISGTVDGNNISGTFKTPNGSKGTFAGSR